MSSAILTIDEAIPTEYRDLVELYLNQSGMQNGSDVMKRFAQALGVSKDFQVILSNEGGDRALRRLLGHFRNNVELLIQKTWVEKSDESYKERLLDRIPSFVKDMEEGNNEKALKTFISILDELAYLLFGPQSKKTDFIEYAFRFDPQMGLFWWYAQNLSVMQSSFDKDSTYQALILGVCFLTAF